MYWPGLVIQHSQLALIKVSLNPFRPGRAVVWRSRSPGKGETRIVLDGIKLTNITLYEPLLYSFSALFIRHYEALLYCI